MQTRGNTNADPDGNADEYAYLDSYTNGNAN
jgi:hypothetical protein